MAAISKPSIQMSVRSLSALSSRLSTPRDPPSFLTTKGQSRPVSDLSLLPLPKPPTPFLRQDRSYLSRHQSSPLTRKAKMRAARLGDKRPPLSARFPLDLNKPGNRMEEVMKRVARVLENEKENTSLLARQTALEKGTRRKQL